jgi:hypothetical protein
MGDATVWEPFTDSRIFSIVSFRRNWGTAAVCQLRTVELSWLTDRKIADNGRPETNELAGLK